ncbi:MAG: hypothetical protein ACI8PG_005555, partial [Planctomycetota bacterium]
MSWCFSLGGEFATLYFGRSLYIIGFNADAAV